MLIGRHWLSLHCSNKQSCWTYTAYLTSSSSIFPLPILLAGWVTSRRRTCWPCAGKFTAGCNHLLCSKRMMFELLHLRVRAALYCKCAISIHEGIYMQSQATLPVFKLWHSPKLKGQFTELLKRMSSLHLCIFKENMKSFLNKTFLKNETSDF